MRERQLLRESECEIEILLPLLAARERKKKGKI